MSEKTILKTIKSTVRSFLPDARVLLFGSRARGNEKPGSDYDLLIVTAKTYPIQTKMKWESSIHVALVNSLRVSFDILINSEKEISWKKKLPGHVIRSAMNEAVEL
jgi:predicted nucleotidyltransferase